MAEKAKVGSIGAAYDHLAGFQAHSLPKLLSILDSALITSTCAQILQWLPAVAK